MKKSLLLLAAAVVSFGASAHYQPGTNITNDITASKVGTAEDGKVIWIVPKANQQLFGSRVGQTKYFEKGMFDLPEGTEYAAVWNYDNQALSDLRLKSFATLDLMNVEIHLTTGSNIAGTPSKKGKGTIVTDYTPNPHISVAMIITSLPYNEAGDVYTAVLDYGIVADDVSKNIAYKPQSVTVSTPDGTMFDAIDNIKVLFDNVEKGKDWVSIQRQMTFPLLEKVFTEPTLSIGKTVSGLKKGEIRIQAEDFDGPKEDGAPAHSNTKSNSAQWTDGYGYDGRHRDWDSTCENIRIDINHESPAGSKGFNLWQPNNGSTDQGTGFALVNFAQQDWDAKYTGPTAEDGTASLDDLADFYGAWAEYSFIAEEEMYADVSLRIGVHNANFQAYRNGSANCPNVTGEGVNYFAKYGGAYRIFVDGKPVRSNWSVRPSSAIHDIHDFSTWLPNTEESALRAYGSRSNDTNSCFVYATPDVAYEYGNKDACGNTWSSVYKSEIGDKLAAEGKLDDVAKAAYDTPDFANIYLTPGKHTIKVQSMGGRTTFDELKVQAHPNADTPTGLDTVMGDFVGAEDADAPVEYFNLQGMRVENPAGGIFIRRQGTRVSKVVIK